MCARRSLPHYTLAASRLSLNRSIFMTLPGGSPRLCYRTPGSRHIMHEDIDVIPALQRRLIVYRRTIEYLEHQRAQFGAFTPAYIWHQFDDTRSEIAQIKRELRALGAAVDDLPGDSDALSGASPNAARTLDGRALLPIYQRMIVDQLRYLSLAGLSSWTDLNLRLDSLYIERTLVPLN